MTYIGCRGPEQTTIGSILAAIVIFKGQKIISFPQTRHCTLVSPRCHRDEQIRRILLNGYSSSLHPRQLGPCGIDSLKITIETGNHIQCNRVVEQTIILLSNFLQFRFSLFLKGDIAHESFDQFHLFSRLNTGANFIDPFPFAIAVTDAVPEGEMSRHCPLQRRSHGKYNRGHPDDIDP